MGAFFAATGRAPITAIIMLFEMTGDYKIILPLMLCCGLSTSTSARLLADSIYTKKLSRRGVRIDDGKNADLMDQVMVKDSMTSDMPSIEASASIKALSRLFASTNHHGFPVLDDDGKLYGVVSVTDAQGAYNNDSVEGMTVKDIATTDIIVAYPDEPMSSAVRRMGRHNLGRLPVVDRSDPKKLLGMVRRSDLYTAYHVASMQQVDRDNRAKRLLAIRREQKSS
jgi:CIC family chloride channel protein